MENESLGCGKVMRLGCRCGEVNAWGKEHLCQECELKMRKGWKVPEKNGRNE